MACVHAWYYVRMKKLTITEFASMGGKARAEKLSKKRRIEIATAASMAALGGARLGGAEGRYAIIEVARHRDHDVGGVVGAAQEDDEKARARPSRCRVRAQARPMPRYPSPAIGACTPR